VIGNEKIRIRLKAYDTDSGSVDSEIVETASATGARLAGPIPLAHDEEQVLRAAFAAPWIKSRGSSLRSAPISVCSTFWIRPRRRWTALMKARSAGGRGMWRIKAFGKEHK